MKVNPFNQNNQNNPEPESFPFLQKAGRTNPFTTPEGYFEKLPLDIADKMAAPSAPLFSTPKLIFIAGMLASVLVAGMWYFSGNTGQSAENQVVLSYDDLPVSAIEDELVLDAFVDVSTATDDEDSGSDDSDTYHDYLIENNTDISLIINEL